MSSAKPTVLLVHGSFHGPECWHLVKPKIEALSYPVVTVSLATVGRQNPTATYLNDVAAIHKVILPILDEGKEVVIVAHSWGGIPGVASIENQSIAERVAKGQIGGVKAILLIASGVILKRGATLAETNGYDSVNYMDFEEEKFGVCNPLSKDVFYNDLSPAVAEYYYSLLRPNAVSAFFTPVNYILEDLKIPKKYIVCEKDNAVPLSKQEENVASVKDLKSVRFEGGHSPFLSKPDWLVTVIDEFVSGGNV